MPFQKKAVSNLKLPLEYKKEAALKMQPLKT